MRQVYVCEEHGERADAMFVVQVVDGVRVHPGSVTCSECGRETRLMASESLPEKPEE